MVFCLVQPSAVPYYYCIFWYTQRPSQFFSICWLTELFRIHTIVNDLKSLVFTRTIREEIIQRSLGVGQNMSCILVHQLVYITVVEFLHRTTAEVIGCLPVESNAVADTRFARYP